MNKKTNTVYTPASMVTLATAHKLSSYLLGTIFYSNEIKRFDKREQNICMSIIKADSLTRSATGEVLKINH